MKMKDQLKLLEDRRQAELKHLHGTYLSTKRAVRRTTSPDRAIRRHMAISLGIAALAGLLLASHLGRRRDKATNSTRLGPMSKLHQFLTEMAGILITRLNLPKLMADIMAKKLSGLT